MSVDVAVKGLVYAYEVVVKNRPDFIVQGRDMGEAGRNAETVLRRKYPAQAEYIKISNIHFLGRLEL